MKPNTHIRPLALSIALALAGNAHANSEFAKVPPYLQNQTTITGQPTVKHNIMLLVDDSGSMNELVDCSYLDEKTGQKAPKSNCKIAKQQRPNDTTRVQALKSALHNILDTYQDKYNWGMTGWINSDQPSYTDKEQTFSSETVGGKKPWERIKEKVDKIRLNGQTPTTRRYFESAVQLVIPNIKYRCQKTYMVVLTDGDPNTSCNFYTVNRGTANEERVYRHDFNYDQHHNNVNQTVDLDLPGQGQKIKLAQFDLSTNLNQDYNTPEMREAYRYFGASPLKGMGTEHLIRNMCLQKSAGSAMPVSTFWDKAGELNGVRGGLEFFSSKLAKQDVKTRGVDAAGVSWNGNPYIDPKGVDYSKQLIQTLTVSFSADVTPDGKEYLRRGASRPEWYFDAQNAQELVDSFEKIVQQINLDLDTDAPIRYGNTGGTAPATLASGIPDLAATVHVNSGSWSSRIDFAKIAAETGYRQSGSVTVQPSFNNRKTLINTGSGVYDIARMNGSELNNAYFGIADSATGKNSGEWLDLLRWTARIGQDDDIAKRAIAQNYSQAYRIRPNGERDLGDILNGSVASIGETKHERRRYMAAAANDGMVHLFEHTDDPNHPYDLKVSYIPAAIDTEGSGGEQQTIANVLKTIAKSDYTNHLASHRYTVNGGFTLRQTAPVNGTHQTLIFGATGQGGRGAYALNVDAVNSSSPENSLPLFETPKGSANTLGYTIGTPQVARVSVNRSPQSGHRLIDEDVRYAGFLASGYRVENPSDAANETALYVYDLTGKEAGADSKANGNTVGRSGDLIAKITIPNGVGGLSTPALVDNDFDGIADFAYAGDRGGNMYRFDLRGETPKNWTAVRIFQGSGQPVTAAPALSRRSDGSYVVIFGTGSDIYEKDLFGIPMQSVYGIFDNPYAENAAPAAATRSQLQTQTVSEDNGYLYLTNHSVDGDQKGWKIDLAENERVTVKPTMILRTAVLTIHAYKKKATHSTDPCLPTSIEDLTLPRTTILGIHADNGGALNNRNARFTPYSAARTEQGHAYFANGVTRDGFLNFTYLDSKRTGEDPVTLDGDVGGNGSDEALKPSPTIPNNRCFKEKGTRTLLLNATDNLDVDAIQCGIKRISWRELFF